MRNVVVADKNLRCLQPMLEKWTNLNVSVGRDWKAAGDVPWWHNERALLSLLAGACWTTGGTAFEEFSCDKKSVKQKAYCGRADCFLQIGENAFNCEAKPLWSAASKPDARTVSILTAKLDIARNDAKRARVRGQRSLALLFARPYLPLKKGEREADKRARVDKGLQAWCQQLKKVKCDAVAWVFPKQLRLVADGNLCPGVALLIDEV